MRHTPTPTASPAEIDIPPRRFVLTLEASPPCRVDAYARIHSVVSAARKAGLRCVGKPVEITDHEKRGGLAPPRRRHKR